ncbi:hypothetical protein ACFE04_026961 [Oxalis oulophora]
MTAPMESPIRGDSLLVITINASSVFMEKIYVSIFFIYSPWPKQLGTISLVFNVIMYAAPLTVMIPYALGTLSSLVQLILFATYYRTTKWDEEPKPVEFELEGGTHLPPAGTLNAD